MDDGYEGGGSGGGGGWGLSGRDSRGTAPYKVRERERLQKVRKNPFSRHLENARKRWRRAVKKSEQEGSQPPEWEAYKTEAEAKAAKKMPKAGSSSSCGSSCGSGSGSGSGGDASGLSARGKPFVFIERF